MTETDIMAPGTALSLRGDCPMRHENGNCLPAGGFCTAVNDMICEALHNAYHCGLHNAFTLVSKHLYGEKDNEVYEV